MQITAEWLTGAFGRNVLYWAERMLEEGYVQPIASDGHSIARQPPRFGGWTRACGEAPW
jgi:tyrosine-protein phosphatase YwqE